MSKYTPPIRRHDTALDPGVHRGLPDENYQCAGGFSYSGAKVLLDCPARYRWVHDHPVVKREYDLGHVAHRLILGAGAEFDIGEFADYRTKAAQEWREKARAAGLVPVLAHEHEAAQMMAAAVHDSSAGPLFQTGEAEVSLSWLDVQTGVPLRARLDWLHPNAIVDVKTCDKASPTAIRKAVYDFGYPIQEAAYREGAYLCGLGNLPFVFVFVEKNPPFIVTVAQLDTDASEYGERRWREAIDLYDTCLQADSWPEYTADIETINLPPWAR